MTLIYDLPGQGGYLPGGQGGLPGRGGGFQILSKIIQTHNVPFFNHIISIK